MFNKICSQTNSAETYPCISHIHFKMQRMPKSSLAMTDIGMS